MKKVSLLLILVFAAITVSAQESGVSAEAGRKTTFTRNGFWDNWFIGAGAGANIYFGKDDSHASLSSRPTLSGNFQVGKWYNPYLGARLKGTYGKVHTFKNDANVMRGSRMITAEVDFMWDMFNYLGKYNSKRFYSLIPYVGAGAAFGNGYSDNHYPTMKGGKKNRERSLSFNGGLINRFRLSDKLALEIELSAMLIQDDFDKRSGGKWAYDPVGNASANLVYKLGKTDFAENIAVVDQSAIDRLNDEINRLRRENERLSVPKDCPKCPEAPAPQKVVSGGFKSTSVFFRLGSANIDKNQEAHVYNVSEYLKNNPSAKVKVTGYADKKTGSASINQRLSEKRAKNVANALINKYNIDSNRVAVEWKGDTEQPYTNNEWNRVAIVLAND